jgi:DNA polymerase III delta prime subunit
MDDFLWVEKYRPQKISDTILPNSIKKTFADVVRGGALHNMLLTGTAGTGKTTIAKALCNELDLDYLLINGSEESGIDTLRNKIKKFASSVSLQGGYKVVINPTCFTWIHRRIQCEL